MWNQSDLGPFDPDNDDKRKIEAGSSVPCRLCENAFGRLRVTRRYCMSCKHGFCDGEHGNFAPGRGRCVQCGPHVRGR